MPSGIIHGMSINPKPTELTRAIVAQLNAAYDEQQARGGMNQTRLGEAMGVTQPQVSRILSGKKAIHIEHLDAMCTALHLDLIELLDTAKRTTRELPAAPAVAAPAEPAQRRLRTGTTAHPAHGHSPADVPGATSTKRSRTK